jgi:hypothetical protein
MRIERYGRAPALGLMECGRGLRVRLNCRHAWCIFQVRGLVASGDYGIHGSVVFEFATLPRSLPMSPTFSRLGWVLAMSLTATGSLIAQTGGSSNQEVANDERPAKPTGPAAKKADDLIRAYTARIEKEIEQGRKEVDRLRTELHELIDVRDAMAEAIAGMRGEMATKGTYSGEMFVPVQSAPKPAPAPTPAMATQYHRDFVYGLGSALPKAPTSEQREQLRRLAPRGDLKRMIVRLRAEVDETRDEVDQLAYKLLELNAGIPASFQGMGGGMGGAYGQWFGSLGRPMGEMGGGMR